MRVVFLGDIVGRAGRAAMAEHLPRLKDRLKPDAIVVNGENAAGGFGITERIAGELFDLGVDAITTGNHAFDQRESLSTFASEPRLLRPLNYPLGTPGRGEGLFLLRRGPAEGARLLVVNVMGRVFMEPLDDPFAAVEAALGACPLKAEADFVLVDVHAEATSEKMAMGHFCDGRASLVVGTHSHVPTADAQILPQGTAYQTDAGACADYDSVIGMEKDEPLNRFTRKIPGGRFQPAEGPATLCGIFVESDEATGLALRAAPIRLGGRLIEALPEP
ncbi:MAG: YmdB family metallophosphoesterase [Alphaproteobacteria bacterium]|nr:YmdB family metallophosphoesterase [Alphaproteobacteria bacterium]